MCVSNIWCTWATPVIQSSIVSNIYYRQLIVLLSGWQCYCVLTIILHVVSNFDMYK